MNTKLIAALACAAALALGACSGGNPPAGPTGADRGTPDDDNGDSGPTAASLEQQAKAAIDRANAAAPGARAGAQTEIENARKAIDDAVDAAEAAYKAIQAPASATPTAQLAAYDRLTRLQALQETQTRRLDDALDSLAWWGGALARYELANGEAATPRENTNKVTINRIPRTIDTSETDSTQKRNPKAFCQKSHEPATCDEDTFKIVMYEDGKKLFSDVDVEFKVDGWTRSTFSGRGSENYLYTGVKLTRDGLVIRTGGGTPFPHNQRRGDFTDARRNIKYATEDSNFDFNHRASSGETAPSGQNAWDLEITFDAPRTMPVPDAPDGRNWVASWQGNGDFYWKAIVPAAKSQLETDGDYYESDAFNQPDGYKDLGTYEVWLSNHVGVKRNLEREDAYPEDDEQLYLDYAAYGLFVYTVDTETFPGRPRRADNAQIGRVNSLNFGYSAFADEENKRTTDIGQPITGGKFQGQALAYAYKGVNDYPDPNPDPSIPRYFQEFKLLRGDATLTVAIPKIDRGTITGTLNNFKEWTAAGWKVFGTDFKVDLTSGVITTSGDFSGTATATSTDNVLGTIDQTLFGGTYPAPSGTGSFKGAFYGPRDDSADLEVAGTWTTGWNNFSAGNFDVVGSFGAKQRPAAAPGS